MVDPESCGYRGNCYGVAVLIFPACERTGTQRTYKSSPTMGGICNTGRLARSLPLSLKILAASTRKQGICSHHMTVIWVAVQELKLSYCIVEILLLATCTHYGSLV